LIPNGNLDDSRLTRFQRLSASIGRFFEIRSDETTLAHLQKMPSEPMAQFKLFRRCRAEIRIGPAPVSSREAVWFDLE
jgi:hypothetical protein